MNEETAYISGTKRGLRYAQEMLNGAYEDDMERIETFQDAVTFLLEEEENDRLASACFQEFHSLNLENNDEAEEAFNYGVEMSIRRNLCNAY